VSGPGWIARLVALAGALGGLRRRRPPAPDAEERRVRASPAGSPAIPPALAEEVPPERAELQSNPGSELLVALLLLAAAVAFAGFVAFYVVHHDTQLLGLCLGTGLLLLGVASALAGKRVVIEEKAVEDYHDFGEEEEQREVEDLMIEGKLGITRRRLLFSSLAVVGAALGAAAVVPIASLGPAVGEKVYDTPWDAGKKLVDEKGAPVTTDTLAEGEFLTAFPAGASKEDIGSPVILVRLRADQLELPSDRAHSAPHGFVAYSKICTHAGCAVSMLRYPTFEPTQPGPALVCPCHYSSFNPADGGSVLFGPAGRPLPQLPLRVAPDGSLEAAGTFYEAIGPSYGGIREYPKGRPL
jgi:ubiquinol-cytochrome c reductase iron-sulfur subunit